MTLARSVVQIPMNKSLRSRQQQEQLPLGI